MKAKTLATLAADPARFRACLHIDADGPAIPLAEVIENWQDRDFRTLDNGWRQLADVPLDSNRPTFNRAYLERPRGHSKTTDLAVMVAWALFAARRQLFGVAAAADKDQARLLRDAVAKLVRINPWLAQILQVLRNRVENIYTNSTLEILSSDENTSYGLTPDFVIVDELTHWTSRALWDSLFSAAAKRSKCVFVVISNAGLMSAGTGWQWLIRETTRTTPTWYFSRLDGPCASWITPDRLAEQQRMLPAKAFKRLWLNEWQPEAGDALELADIEAAVKKDLGPLVEAELLDWHYLAGLDLGTRRDHSAFVVLGRHRKSGRLRLAHCQSWAPNGGSIDLGDVQAAVKAADVRFRRFAAVNYDPHQCDLLASQLRRQGVQMNEVPFVGKQLTAMASAVLETFRSRTIDLYPDPLLIHDLQRLSIVERPFGFKLESVRDELGHADRATALALALLAARECPAPREFIFSME